MTPLEYPPPPPGGNSRPSNDLRPNDRNAIQPYMSREMKQAWVYIPESVKRSAVCDDLVSRDDDCLYWDAMRLRIIVLEKIAERKDDQDSAALHILFDIEKATAAGLKEVIQYVGDLADQRPFNSEYINGYLLEIWKWNLALVHGEMVDVYLGYSPYNKGASDWRAKAAYSGKYFWDVDEDVHFIRQDDGTWVSFEDPTIREIRAGLAIIKERDVKQLV
ncbi:hypothetical protein V491_04702 [Pseudogymnoascus sp. VKM F-3775]|nr:hypothetical protein V491_04702 [Pseudogymnoascus sp. VKM F-3775]